MSQALKRRYSLEEYFKLELESDTRYEYRDGEISALSGGSPEHEQVIANLVFHLKDKLRGRPCRVFPSNLRVKVPQAPPYRYPDLTALCGEPQYEEIGGVKTLINPALIVEVLSPTTEAFDRGDKFTFYKSIPSFGEYLLVAQHRPHMTQYVKRAEGFWSYQEFNSLTETVTLASLNCSLALSEAYEEVAFAPPENYIGSSRPFPTPE